MAAQDTGPLMLCATDALKPPKLRIGHIGGNLTLPRTIPAMTLLVGLGGALFGVVFGGIFFGYTISAIMYSATFGGAAGVAAVTYSPLRGESLAKWLGLKVKTHRQQVTIDGRNVRAAVGICYVTDPQLGSIHMRAGSVPVPAGSVDERGAFVPVVAHRPPRFS